MPIKYWDGYKYVLAEDYGIKTVVWPEKEIDLRYIRLATDGTLTIRAGYAWDGPSGPTIDSKSAMRASLVHDALYQLMRAGLLSLKWRPSADELLYGLCVEDGMWRWRAALWRREVKKFAAFAALPENEEPVKIAP